MKADKADHHRSCQLAAQLSSLQQKNALPGRTRPSGWG